MHLTADITMEHLARLKRVGFWRSDKEPSLPDPRTLVDQAWDIGERDRMIAYLENSYFIPVAQGGPSWCRFGCSPRPLDIGTQDLTDGTWVFPEGFVHYVRSHGVKPPVEFLEHVRQRHFRVALLAVLREHGEPDGPAGRNQPVGSETNRTSRTAGSNG